MKTRPNSPRTGRKQKLRLKKSSRPKLLGKRSPKQIAASMGKRKRRKR